MLDRLREAFGFITVNGVSRSIPRRGPPGRRWALLAWCSALFTACLYDPPSYTERSQIPPVVNPSGVLPPIGQFYRGPRRLSLSVPFRSDDGNVALIARLYLDLVPGASRGVPQGEQEISPGYFEDLERSADVDWASPVTGCHSLTMIITYVDNFSPITLLPKDYSFATAVVWWLLIDADATTTPVGSCPSSSTSPN
jgi:hypothetical protein